MVNRFVIDVDIDQIFPRQLPTAGFAERGEIGHGIAAVGLLNKGRVKSCIRKTLRGTQQQGEGTAENITMHNAVARKFMRSISVPLLIIHGVRHSLKEKEKVRSWCGLNSPLR
ncbi:hypothetical protein D3C76_1128090 [compost metagenome]